MKMVMVVVPSNTAEQVLDALVNSGHTATYAETRGGMLRQSQFSLFIAVEQDQLDQVLEIVRENCRTKVEMSTRPSGKEGSLVNSPLTADLGGAIAFIWDINQVETF